MLMDIKLIDMKMPMMHVSSDIEGIIIENCQFDSISTVTKNILVKNSNIGVLTSIDSKKLKDIDSLKNSKCTKRLRTSKAFTFQLGTISRT